MVSPADTWTQSQPTLVPGAVEQRAAASPNGLAAEDPSRKLTYGQLTGRVNHLANRLAAAQVGRQHRVGVMMAPSCDFLVAVLAILRSGAVYVPLDRTYPDARKGYLASDSGITLLLTDRGNGKDTPFGSTVPTVQLDDGSAECCVRAHQVRPDDAACIIYTSGSTGVPKGVVITHRGLSNLTFAARDEFQLQPQDRYLMLASAAFSASLEELFPPLIAGAACVFPADSADLLPADRLLAFATSHNITMLELQTAQWHLLVRHLTDKRVRLPSSLRLMVMGGDRPLAEALEAWNLLDMPLVHVYGPTETTATATYWAVPRGKMPKDGVLSIGAAIPHTRLAVVDDDLQLVAPGQAGELLIGGASLARGYHDQPAATAERFIPDPFAGISGDRLYRTGDLVRELPDGRLQFLGRLDDQLKIGGYRVEPGEIEHVLQQHMAVRQALVVSREQPDGLQHLVAYVAAAPETVTAPQLRRFLADKLPSHMLPSFFVRLDAFPLTIHCKVDKQALPGPPEERVVAEAAAAAPGDALESHLSLLIGEILGLEGVGVGDNFLDLGGTSLHMLRLLMRIHLYYQVHIGFREAFASPTVRGIAELVRRSPKEVE